MAGQWRAKTSKPSTRDVVAQRKRREKRVPPRRQGLLDLAKDGFVVKELSPYCIRVNGRLDCYLTHNRWHDITMNERGGTKDLAIFAREFFKGTVQERTRWRTNGKRLL